MCLASEDVAELTLQENSEIQRFREMTRTYEAELAESIRTIMPATPCQIFEVFCGDKSQLTQQCQRLGQQGERFLLSRSAAAGLRSQRHACSLGSSLLEVFRIRECLARWTRRAWRLSVLEP